MGLTPSSWAAGVGSSVLNKQFQAAVENVPRKQLLIGSYDPLILTITDDVPVQVFSADEVAATYGRGFMLHLMAKAAFDGNNGEIEVWVLPNPEDGAAVQATGTLTLGAGPASEAGTLSLYIGGVSVPVAVANGAIIGDIGDLVDAAILANPDLPVTSANVAGVVTFTAKDGGAYGNNISITLNWGVGEELPAALTAVIVDMAAGATDPAYGDAIDGMGTGDNANSEFWTGVNIGYGFLTPAVLEAFSVYNGIGNTATGCYDDLVSRPFRLLHGDVVADSAGLTAILAIANANLLDRTNGALSAPGSPEHPVWLACRAMGTMERINNIRAAESYVGQPLVGVIPGVDADRWTKDYANRNIAVLDGVSTTKVASGVLTIQDVLTFYHPDNVAIESNGYRSMRNISIGQNMLANIRANFEREKWQGISIVRDAGAVGNLTDREKVRDIAAVLDDLVLLVQGFYDHAWIFEKAFTLGKLAEGDKVVIRPGGKGFNMTLPVLLSGEGTIFDTETQFDTSLAIVL